MLGFRRGELERGIGKRRKSWNPPLISDTTHPVPQCKEFVGLFAALLDLDWGAWGTGARFGRASGLACSKHWIRSSCMIRRLPPSSCRTFYILGRYRPTHRQHRQERAILRRGLVGRSHHSPGRCLGTGQRDRQPGTHALECEPEEKRWGRRKAGFHGEGVSGRRAVVERWISASD